MKIFVVTSDECKPCQAGKFCKEGNTGPCDEGTICKRASQNRNGDSCDAASECNIDVENDIGAVVQIDCSIGQFGTNNECKQCPEGSYCPEVLTENPIECAPGHVCPASTGNIESTDGCPIGTYMETPCDELNSELCCKKCPAGSACSEYRATEPTEKCKPGFYCDGENVLATENPCSPGQYCPDEGNQSDDDGTECLKGSYYKI